jgi:predicted RND superfamily exporter protein
MRRHNCYYFLKEKMNQTDTPKKQITRKRIVMRTVPLQIIIMERLNDNITADNIIENLTNNLTGGNLLQETEDDEIDKNIFKLILDLTYMLFLVLFVIIILVYLYKNKKMKGENEINESDI